MTLGGEVGEADAVQELRRYTDVLAVLDTLKNQRITLLSTTRWIDRNDRAALRLFGERVGCQTVVAYCLTEAKETFHHWQVFAGQGFGACIVFDKQALIDHVAKVGLLQGKVKYRTALKLGSSKAPVIRDDQIPFLKREVFADEREYRIISGAPEFLESSSIEIDLSLIRRVVLGPSIPRPLVETLEQIIRSFDGCATLRLHYSHLHDNQIWSESLTRRVGGKDRPKPGASGE